MTRHDLTRELPRVMLIQHPNPHELAMLVQRDRLVVVEPITLVAPGRYGVLVQQPARPIRVHRRRGAGTLGLVLGALVLLTGAAVAVGWWATHGLPLLCSLFVAGAVVLVLVIRKLPS